MSGKFDPYYKWLGIPAEEQPPNHYRLLGVRSYEPDAEVIDAAANRLMSYLQELATGPEVDHAQKLLNEVSAARVCLLDSSKKTAYDAALKRESAPPAPPKAPPIAHDSGAGAEAAAAPVIRENASPAGASSAVIRRSVAPHQMSTTAAYCRSRRKKQNQVAWIAVGLAAVAAIGVAVLGLWTVNERPERQTSKPEPAVKTPRLASRARDLPASSADGSALRPRSSEQIPPEKRSSPTVDKAEPIRPAPGEREPVRPSRMDWEAAGPAGLELEPISPVGIGADAPPTSVDGGAARPASVEPRPLPSEAPSAGTDILQGLPATSETSPGAGPEEARRVPEPDPAVSARPAESEGSAPSAPPAGGPEKGTIKAAKPRYHAKKNHPAWRHKGRIVGVAKDAPAFTVTLRQSSGHGASELGVERGSKGFSVFEPWLEPGKYHLEIQAEGYKPLTLRDLEVRADHDLAIELEFAAPGH